MKPVSKNIIFGFMTVVIFFACLELALRFFVLPCSYDFIERTIILQGLKPKKQPGEFRAFFYGGSTMHGSQLYPKSKIDIWLKLYLENLLGKDTAQRLQSTNFGRLGASTDFIAKAFSDTLAYKPDLVVFYTAHNDFIIKGNREKLVQSSRWDRLGESLTKDFFEKSRLVSLLKRLSVAGKVRKQAKKKESEIFERWFNENEQERYREGMMLSDPLSPGYQIVKKNWENNIEKIISQAQKHKVPVILFMGVSRWQGFPPFKPLHRKDLSSEDLARWESLYRQGIKSFEAREYQAAIKFFEEALEVDPQYAMGYYQLGQSYEKLGQIELARKNYQLSDFWDYFPIRGPASVNEFYEKLRQRNLPGVYFIDTQKAFELHSPSGLPDERLVIDQLHPTMEGQALMAKEIAKIFDEENLFAAEKDWAWAQVAPWEELAENLDIDEEFIFQADIRAAEYDGSYYEEAIKLIEKALLLRPQSVRARSMLAWTNWQLGNLEKAKEIYLQLNKDAPELAGEFFARQPEIRAYVFPPSNK